MGLESVAVKRCALSQEVSSNLGVSERFVIDRFDVVVVDVKLDIGSGGVGVVELRSAGPPMYSQHI